MQEQSYPDQYDTGTWWILHNVVTTNIWCAKTEKGKESNFPRTYCFNPELRLTESWFRYLLVTAGYCKTLTDSGQLPLLCTRTLFSWIFFNRNPFLVKYRWILAYTYTKSIMMHQKWISELPISYIAGWTMTQHTWKFRHLSRHLRWTIQFINNESKIASWRS